MSAPHKKDKTAFFAKNMVSKKKLERSLLKSPEQELKEKDNKQLMHLGLFALVSYFLFC